MCIIKLIIKIKIFKKYSWYNLNVYLYKYII